MSYYAPFPFELQQVEYVKLYFYLENSNYFDLPDLGLLQLRRELRQGLKSFSDLGQDDYARELTQLLQPDLPDDPVLLRQIQQPSPAFVISPDTSLCGLIAPKQRICLPVLFLGSGIKAIDFFVSLLQHLGTRGLYHGCGRYILEGVEAEDGSGVRSMLWSKGKQTYSLNPPVCRLSWWLERKPSFENSVQFEIVTPLRILRQGKPFFKAGFADIFPFLLRRVTSLLAAYAGVELSPYPAHYISMAKQVKVVQNSFHWKDWRTLNNEHGDQNLGGLMGALKMQGDELSELLWLLQLGHLFNIGKGATYGAGQYRLIYS
nr:CRISPR system precrRNA processing endoribonuclease RAMP protein Cas6 [uncultured Desulfuromusa sp.]